MGDLNFTGNRFFSASLLPDDNSYQRFWVWTYDNQANSKRHYLKSQLLEAAWCIHSVQLKQLRFSPIIINAGNEFFYKKSSQDKRVSLCLSRPQLDTGGVGRMFMSRQLRSSAQTFCSITRALFCPSPVSDRNGRLAVRFIQKRWALLMIRLSFCLGQVQLGEEPEDVQRYVHQLQKFHRGSRAHARVLNKHYVRAWVASSTNRLVKTRHCCIWKIWRCLPESLYLNQGLYSWSMLVIFRPGGWGSPRYL